MTRRVKSPQFASAPAQADAVGPEARARAKALKALKAAGVQASEGTVNAVTRQVILAARAERDRDRQEEFEATRDAVVAELRRAALGLPATDQSAEADADDAPDKE